MFWFQIISSWSTLPSLPLCFFFFYSFRALEVEGAMGFFHYSTASRKRLERLLWFAMPNMLEFMLPIQDFFQDQVYNILLYHLACFILLYSLDSINFFIQRYLERISAWLKMTEFLPSTKREFCPYNLVLAFTVLEWGLQLYAAWGQKIQFVSVYHKA